MNGIIVFITFALILSGAQIGRHSYLMALRKGAGEEHGCYLFIEAITFGILLLTLVNLATRNFVVS